MVFIIPEDLNLIFILKSSYFLQGPAILIFLSPDVLDI